MFNDTNIPSSTSRFVDSSLTRIGWGNNLVSISIDSSDYDALRSRLEQPMDLLQLYRTMSRTCNVLSGAFTENASTKRINRKQIQKDLSREEIIINGRSYESPTDLVHMKRDLLSNVALLDGSHPDRSLQPRSATVSGYPSSSSRAFLSYGSWSLLLLVLLI